MSRWNDHILDHLYTLLADENWSEVYSIGQQLVREECDLKDALMFLTFAFSVKEHVEIYPEVLEYARVRAKEEGLTPEQTRKVLMGL